MFVHTSVITYLFLFTSVITFFYFSLLLPIYFAFACIVKLDLSRHFLLKWLYKTRKLSSRVFYVYLFCIFLPFFDWIFLIVSIVWHFLYFITNYFSLNWLLKPITFLIWSVTLFHIYLWSVFTFYLPLIGFYLLFTTDRLFYFALFTTDWLFYFALFTTDRLFYFTITTDRLFYFPLYIYHWSVILLYIYHWSVILLYIYRWYNYISRICPIYFICLFKLLLFSVGLRKTLFLFCSSLLLSQYYS